MLPMTAFVTWVNDELNRRGWSRSEAARRGGISSSILNKIIGGFSNPGLEACMGLSRAFNVPLEDVFRLAGILPSQMKVLPATRDSQRVIYEIDGDQVLLAKFHALNGDDQALVRGLIARLVDCDAPRIIGEPDAQT
jgi:transcriptional regulator with XRE-family HTH domain